MTAASRIRSASFAHGPYPHRPQVSLDSITAFETSMSESEIQDLSMVTVRLHSKPSQSLRFGNMSDSSTYCGIDRSYPWRVATQNSIVHIC